MKGGGHRETWTVGMLTRLRELHAAGMTFGQIANALNAEFGSAVTRNSCVGKGRRLKLPARKSPIMIDSRPTRSTGTASPDGTPPRQGRAPDCAAATDLHPVTGPAAPAAGCADHLRPPAWRLPLAGTWRKNRHALLRAT